MHQGQAASKQLVYDCLNGSAEIHRLSSAMSAFFSDLLTRAREVQS